MVEAVSLMTWLLSSPIRVLKRVDKRSEVSYVSVLNEDKHTLEYGMDSAEQVTGALTLISLCAVDTTWSQISVRNVHFHSFIHSG